MSFLEFQNLFYYFIIYSFLGWCLEVVYHIFTEKKFINRGFLHGPLCPIYGSCGALLAYFVKPVQHNYILVFLVGAVIASIVEYIAGYVLEHLFGARWWDYSQEKFNLKGYICLKFSLIWGFISIFILNIVQPRIEGFVASIPHTLFQAFFVVLMILFVADFCLTINDLITFKKLLGELNYIANGFKENFKGMKKEFVEEARLNNLKKYENSARRRLSRRHKNLLKAYPNITSERFNHVIKYIKTKKAIIDKKN